jgi:hypothetical protein
LYEAAFLREDKHPVLGKFVFTSAGAIFTATFATSLTTFAVAASPAAGLLSGSGAAAVPRSAAAAVSNVRHGVRRDVSQFLAKMATLSSTYRVKMGQEHCQSAISILVFKNNFLTFLSINPCICSKQRTNFKNIAVFKSKKQMEIKIQLMLNLVGFIDEKRARRKNIKNDG